MALFQDLELQESIIRAVEDMGFEEMTPIQEKIIPYALTQMDLIGQAQTGTGKTAAFGIPMLSKIDPAGPAVQAMVLAPTRELAIQVAEEINRLAKYKDVHALAIYGGENIGRQINGLRKKPQIVVATPGRFMDHMRRKTIRLDQITMVVLDEADEMLSMGFIEDIEEILSEVPEDRQTLLFSATMPRRIQEVSKKFMKEPTLVAVKAKTMTVDTIDQKYLETKERDKFDILCNLLDTHDPELSIIFGRTKRRVDELTEALSIRGYNVEGIHGDLKQERREKVLRKFKRGAINILVATDVAARGLDISGVSHVFNFDLPQDPESYVHRIGRTGRAGKKGISFTFVTPRERDFLGLIENTTKSKMERYGNPTLEQARKARYEQAADRLLGFVEEERGEELRETARRLLEEYDPVTVVASALKMLTKEVSTQRVSLTEEQPLRMKSKKKQGGYNRNDRYKGKGGYKGNNKDGKWNKGDRKDSKKFHSKSSGKYGGKNTGKKGNDK